MFSNMHLPEPVRNLVDRVIVFGNREPILTIRRVLWILTAGFWLAALYGVVSLVMLSTIIFAPFALGVLQVAVYALDGGITLEPVPVERYGPNVQAPFWRNPGHPYTIAANVAWALLIGWALVLFHLAAAAIQALTVVGLGTALTFLELAAFVIWPFGRTVRRRELPTTLADLHLSRMPPTPSEAWV